MFIVERGTLMDFEPTGYTATVRFAGSLSSVVPGVPVARGIAAAELVDGRRVAVAVFDSGSPSDAMIVGVW